MKTVLLLLFVSISASFADSRPNVLFLAADDLRPQFGCYGQEWMHTPNVDALASRGTVFERAYCQAPVCRASRVSVMTGLRPDSTEVWTNGSRHKTFRDHLPDHITLSQNFISHGYDSWAFGKIYHGAFKVRDRWNDPKSWTRIWFTGPRYYYTEEGIASARKVFGKRARDLGVPVDEWVNHFVLGLSHEAPEVSDDVLQDGQIALQGIAALRELKEMDTPFFLALGFLKPHLPFIAPKKYWDLYPPEKVVTATNRDAPKDAPPMAATNWGHPRTYSDFPNQGEPSDELFLELTRGYAACVSYVDAQIGRVLDELEALGLQENTIVILWGDHGWHVGENHIWGKGTNFEMSARAPLILADPSQEAKGTKTKALVEFVDIYPTLAELAGLPVPDNLEGTSFAALLDDPELSWKSAAFTEYPSRAQEQYQGHSMRTDRYRFIRWTRKGDPGTTAALELYDHEVDPKETVNLANHPEKESLVKRLNAQLDAGWEAAGPPQSSLSPARE